MRVFVTGASGFIGSHVVRELLGNGHDVLGMTRSDAGESTLAAMGADVQRATLEDPDGLRKGADGADAVIHLGFDHDFTRFAENCKIDEGAIRAMGTVLAGTGRPLIVTSVLGGLAGHKKIATEDMVRPENSPIPRVSEQAALSLRDVNVTVMRLSQVHNTDRQGLASNLIDIARDKGVSAYVGGGSIRWAAVHVEDVARLFRLALEKHEKGAVYHAVAEEGVLRRDIAGAIAQGLGVPVKSLSPPEAQAHFGWFAMFADHDIMASSRLTREKLGWIPTGPGLIADLERMEY